MDDLEAAIDEADNNKNNEPDNTPTVSNVEVSNLSNRAKKANEGPSESHDEPLQFKENEFVIAMFEDGPYPGEVMSIGDTEVTVNFLKPATVDKKRSFEYWKWPFVNDRHTISNLSILPIRPSLDIAVQFSNNRSVVFQLLNYDLVEKFI